MRLMSRAKSGAFHRAYTRIYLPAIAVAASFLVREAVVSFIREDLPPFAVFYPAVLFVALEGGMWSGIFTTALSAVLVDFWILAPRGSLAIADRKDAIGLVLFCGMGVFMSLIADRDRRNRKRIADYERQRAVHAANVLTQEKDELLGEVGRLAKVGGWDLNPLTGEFHWADGGSRIFDLDHSVRGKKESAVDLYDSESRPRIEAAIRDTLERGTPFDTELQIPSSTGAHQWVRITCYPQVENGRVANLRGSVHDITERKQAEAKLQTAEALFARVFQSSPCAISVFRLSDDRWIDVNSAYLQMTGYSLQEVIGHSPWELNLYVDPAMREGWSKRLHAEKRIEPQDAKIRRKSGEVRDVLASIEATDIGGEPLAILMALDVTERNDAERALRKSAELLRLFFDHAPVALAMFDRDMRYLHASRRWAADYGLETGDLRGLSHYQVFPEISERWKEIHRRGQTGEIVREESDRFVRADGSVQWVRWEVRPWYQTPGEVGGIVIFTEDVTERKRTELDLLQALEAKTALLKEVHHRVKNNLQIVSSMLNLQARHVNNPAALETLRDTQGRIRAMAILHETLYREGHEARVDCALYFRLLCQHLRRTFDDHSQRIRLNTDLAAVELDIDVVIPCGLIVNELVSNAFKHGFPAGRRGEITVRLSAPSDRLVLLSVGDDGIGLPPHLDYLHCDTLGLQLVTGFAKQLSGTIAVKSDLGTAIEISFPRSSGDEEKV